MRPNSRSPSELRSIFGANLRALSNRYSSISDLSRQLSINRTQLNRYLSGESFPRPDVLARICDFFGLDARILLEPLEELEANDDPFSGRVLGPYLGPGSVNLPERLLPSGFYRFSRRAFVDRSRYVLGIVWVFREGQHTYFKGFEPKEAMVRQGLATEGSNRLFQGLVMMQNEGVTLMASRRNMGTFSFNYLHPASSFENNYWVGYACRTMREMPEADRVTRMVYEYLGRGTAHAIRASRVRGLHAEDMLPPLHYKYLQTERPFQ